VLKHIDVHKKSALLRFSNANTKCGAQLLTDNGINCIYIPKIPIAEITTESAWLYSAVAKYMILEQYSVYDFISEIPVEGEASKKTVAAVKVLLEKVATAVNSDDVDIFEIEVNNLATYIGYPTRKEHLNNLYQTISDTTFHVAFEPEKYQHIAITFHSSKGLEFEQVIVFAEDYRLSDMGSIYNHYVAVTRAKSKLIIVEMNEYNANCFHRNIARIFNSCSLQISDVVSFK